MQNFKNFCGNNKKAIIVFFAAIIVVLLLTPFIIRISLYYSLRPMTARTSHVKFDLQRKWVVMLADNDFIIFFNKGISISFSERKHPINPNDKRYIEYMKKCRETCAAEAIKVAGIETQALKRIKNSSINDKGKEEVYSFEINPTVSGSVHIQVDNNLKKNEDIAKEFLANNVSMTNQ